MTGIVIDSGDGVTHVVPICDGYVLGSNIKHIPIAGRKITKFMMDMIRERGEQIDTEDLYYAAMEIKEKNGYLAEDILKEYSKFDKDSKKFKRYTRFSIFNKALESLQISLLRLTWDMKHSWALRLSSHLRLLIRTGLHLLMNLLI